MFSWLQINPVAKKAFCEFSSGLCVWIYVTGFVYGAELHSFPDFSTSVDLDSPSFNEKSEGNPGTNCWPIVILKSSVTPR